MISGKNVDYVQVVPKCLSVFACHQHWSYFTLGMSNSIKIFFGQEQMMWTYFASHCQSLRWKKSNRLFIFSIHRIVKKFLGNKLTFSLAARMICISSFLATWQMWMGVLCKLAKSKIAAVVWLSACTQIGYLWGQFSKCYEKSKRNN